MKIFPNVTGALCANSHPGSYTGQDAFNDMLPVIRRTIDDENVLCGEWTAGTGKVAQHGELPGLYARSKNHIGGGINMEKSEEKKYVLRRLTPVECARLQGFPDWWCDGADGSDSAQYKLWGNGIALPCACDVLGRIAEEMKADG